MAHEFKVMFVTIIVKVKHDYHLQPFNTYPELFRPFVFKTHDFIMSMLLFIMSMHHDRCITHTYFSAFTFNPLFIWSNCGTFDSHIVFLYGMGTVNSHYKQSNKDIANTIISAVTNTN